MSSCVRLGARNDGSGEPGSPALVSTTTTPDQASASAPAAAAPLPAAGAPRAPSRWPGLKDTPFPLGLVGIAASQAGASRDQMMWRCQLGPCRISSWSSPVPPCLFDARLRDGARGAGLVQDADPLEVTEGLAPEGLPRSQAASTSPSTRESRRGMRSGVASPTASATCQLFLRATGATRPRRDLAICSRDPRRANRSAKRV
jgi:hypothetical protein